MTFFAFAKSPLSCSILSFPPALGWCEIVLVLVAASALRLIIDVKIPGHVV